MASFWITELSLKAELRLSSGERLGREEFFAWLWHELAEFHLQGVHEGTMLCDEAAESGLETESWLVDSGEAPRNRDWVGSQSQENPQLYFLQRGEAEGAAKRLEGISGCSVVRVFNSPSRIGMPSGSGAFAGSRFLRTGRSCRRGRRTGTGRVATCSW